ncbi:MAG: activator-dependent family glycosyltransferase [Pseudonocardia sp.]
MRVLLTCFPATSHIYNLVPLGWALVDAGHEVRFATHPDGVDKVVDAGILVHAVGRPLDLHGFMHADFTQAGRPHDISESAETLLTPEYVLGVFTWYTAAFLHNVADDAVLDDIVAFARQWQPDVVIWDALTFSGLVAARAVGATSIRVLFGLDHMVRMRHRHLRNGPPGDDPFREWLSGVLADFGLNYDERTVWGDRTIDPMPGWMRLRTDVDYLPVRLLPYNGGSVVPTWIDARPRVPRVCLTLGLSGREMWGVDDVTIADVLRAVAALDVEVVATLSAEQTRLLGDVPDNVVLTDFVSLGALLPSCSAIVHHGGAGTMRNALVHGTPQLIIPDEIWDPAQIADGVQRIGAGLRCDPGDVTEAALRRAVARLIEDPAFRVGAARARQEWLATPGADDLVDSLCRLAAEREGPVLGQWPCV